MKTQVSNLLLSVWNHQKHKPLGSGLPSYPERG